MELLGNLATWFLVFLSYSFLGWCLEMIAVPLIAHHKATNRGFLIGPICPIYGTGAIVMTLLLRNVNNLVAIFIVAVLGSALIEYFTSFMMEKLFRVRWWDYSDKPFNIRGRICLENLFYFGIMGILVIKLMNPFFFGIFTSVAVQPRIILAGTLLAIMVIDYMVSLWLVIACRVTVGTVESDATEEITEHIRAVFMGKGKLNRRLTNAFPSMHVDQTQAARAHIQTKAKAEVKALKKTAKGQTRTVKTQVKAQARAIKTRAKADTKAISQKKSTKKKSTSASSSK